jgi:hypothetical protein
LILRKELIRNKMFPTLKTGLDTVTTQTPDQTFKHSLIVSAFHEIGTEAITQCAILMFHQEAAKLYHLGLQKSEKVEDVYTAEEKKELHQDLITIVMKYHAAHEQGLANKLTPMIEAVLTGHPLDSSVANDAFIQRVLQGAQRYVPSLTTGNLQQTLMEMQDFHSVSEEHGQQLIRDSYNDSEDPNGEISVAIWEDDHVQCACDYCEKFFKVVEMNVEPNSLNFIQRAIWENYSENYSDD